MRYYSVVQKVIVDTLVLDKAHHFAGKVVATTNYSDSNQFSVDKIRQDHFVSKIGEEAVKMVLNQFGEVTGPDYHIYTGSNKSWDDDLFIEKTGIAVKTQKLSIAKKYGLSWTFQCSPNRSDIILQKPDAWVVFVEYDDVVGNVCNVYPPYQVKDLTFEEPFLEKLRGHKKVVYANSLPAVIIL